MQRALLLGNAPCAAVHSRSCYGRFILPGATAFVIYADEVLRHNVQLLKAVRVLWICDVFDVLEHLQRVDELTTVFYRTRGHLYAAETEALAARFGNSKGRNTLDTK